MRDPRKMSKAELMETYALYCNLESKGVGDEAYLTRLEIEINSRNFNDNLTEGQVVPNQGDK